MSCGAKVDWKADKEVSKGGEWVMFCSKCGNEIAEGAAFCRKCGAPVGAPVNATKSVAGAPRSTDGANSPAPKKSGARRGVIAVAAVVVLALVTGFATNWFGLAGVQPEEAALAPTASQDLSDTGSESVQGVDSAGVQDGDVQSESAADEQGGDAQDVGGGGLDSAATAVKSSVEDYTWDELSQISAQIAATGDEATAIEVAKKYNLCTPEGTLDGTQLKSVTMPDGTQDTVQVIGFAHDDNASGGKAGITFAFSGCISELGMNVDITNAGGWEASAIRAALNDDMDYWLPEDLRKVIVPVKKMTNNAGMTASIDDVTETLDALWLPSSVEMWGEYGGDPAALPSEDAIACDIHNAQGVQYKLFSDLADKYKQDGSSSPNSFTIRTSGGVQVTWWMRDPISDSDSDFSCVSDDGLYIYEDGASSTKGVAPCFCV
ncbi:DUF6273 domain-containing protein [Adlercreutzia sp. R25]|uniref:DUF6273 domain-containing protein n=1 Tax=Adlercreutzia shanghongiae TaxID=3111773 RepID=UPI002DBA73DF|nr:DUF6273 domain-containing protein [Adlercreutzia sp. R25]MEC4273328.1 DUF6273 domain-containing protein [Adlercreutzia sp. R25]